MEEASDRNFHAKSLTAVGLSGIKGAVLGENGTFAQIVLSNMAMSNPSSAAPVFMGEFRHAIDGKNRLTIPSEWRFEDEAELFLLPESTGACLKVMPRQEVERIRAQASQLPGPQRAALNRVLGSGTRQVRLDKNGRLVLPPELCERLRLSGQVTLVGAIETFELWNTRAWEAAKITTSAVAGPHLQEFGL